MSLRVVILAAGQGTRMKSTLPKVLHPVAGMSMVNWVVEAAVGAAPDDVAVVVGYGAPEVTAQLPAGVRSVLQEEQKGTGHAVMVALAAMDDVAGDTVVVLPGDAPLLTSATLSQLVETHSRTEPAVTLAVTRLADPFGYGRIVRDEAGEVVGVVEERDATPDQRAIQEVCVSIYAFDGAALQQAINQLGTDNEQGEMYLTDVIGILAAGSAPIAAAEVPATEAQGVNSHDQLAAVAAELRRRLNSYWMQAGVSMLDPERVYLHAGVTLAAGVKLLPDVYLQGNTRVEEGAEVGPSVTAVDSHIAAGAHVWYSVLRRATVGAGAEVGPYASLRPGTVLAESTKAGTFVEMKNTTLGPGSKAPHLSYLGDATVGADSNIGAGTITCNYDGFNKHETIIGDRVRIGSDTMLVAPVEVGDDSWTGAGSTITKDVKPGSLAVERAEQREILDYAERRARREKSSE
jgi:bifunctional UDP-N-acetylglucosamine pyrophosphorylase/glucosamine-1-phosphate N-acetyltransferase